MMGWLSKLFHPEQDDRARREMKTFAAETDNSSARDEARKRLKLVLMHDRTQLSPSLLENMRDELVGVISKYVEIDREALDLSLESESNTIALVANIPVLRSRTS
jgi:cell division topological specificity factor